MLIYCPALGNPITNRVFTFGLLVCLIVQLSTEISCKKSGSPVGHASILDPVKSTFRQKKKCLSAHVRSTHLTPNVKDETEATLQQCKALSDNIFVNIAISTSPLI